MTKKLSFRLGMAALVTMALYSCRSEDLLMNNEETSPPKFKVFSSKEKANYGEGFKTLLERFDDINNSQHTAKAIKNAWENSAKLSDEYVEFNIRSQDITTKNKEVYTLFPFIRNHQVEEIVVGVLRENETIVEFLKMSPDAENYVKILELFRAQYIKSTLQSKNLSKGAGGPCGFDGAPPCGIETVVIPTPGGGGGGSLPPGGGWIPPGGCEPYVDCLHNPDGDGSGGGGGDNNPDPQQNQDPCTKMKMQNQNPDFKAKVTALDKKEMFDKSVETGHAAAYGTIPFEQMWNTPNGNVRLPDGNKYFGYMHTHLDSKPDVIKIFSPYDISTFLTSCVANAKLKGNMADAYAMVITSQGNYILKYSGNGNFAITYGQIQNWSTWYLDNYGQLLQDGKLTQPNVEKLFTQFLKEQVNINGLEVYKSDKISGIINKMEYNGQNNAITMQPCP